MDEGVSGEESPAGGFAKILWDAAFEGKINLVRESLEGCKMLGISSDDCCFDNVTPLYLACEFNHVEVLRLMIENGSDVNRISGHGVQPIYIAAEKGHYACMEILISTGKCYLDCVNVSGFTPLYRLAEWGPLDCMELLLRSGADPNKRNGGGFTPLIVAAERNGIEAVQLLLRFGADATLTCRRGYDVKDFAMDEEIRDTITNWDSRDVEQVQRQRIMETVIAPPPDYTEAKEQQEDYENYKVKCVEDWSAHDVASWLISFGRIFSEYRIPFLDHGVDGQCLLHDIGSDELTELGITRRLHIKRLTREVSKLKSERC